MSEHLSTRDRAARSCADAVAALQLAGVLPEAIAEYVPEGRKLFVLPRPATMRALGEAWRLGSLLLDTEGGLWVAGRATRAAERGRVGYQSVSREERRDIAAAALRGGYAEGFPVNFDARPISLDEASLRELGPTDPIGLAESEIRVRWRTGASLDSAPTLEQYLRERVALLVDPTLPAS